MRLALFVPFRERRLSDSWREQEWPLLCNLRVAGLTVDVVFPAAGRIGPLADFARYRRAMRECDVAAAWYGGTTLRLVAAAAASMPKRHRPRVVWIGLEGEWHTARARARLDRVLLRFVDAVVCNTTGQAAAVCETFPQVAPRVVYVPYGGPNALPDTPTAATAPGPDAGYVFSGGTNNRDSATLLAALDLVGAPAHVVVHGSSGADLHPSANVQVHTDIAFSEFHRLLAGAAVVVLALADMRVSSGLLVLLHAMEMGKPVVVSAFEGVDDYVRDGVDGVVVAPGRPDVVAAAVERLLARPEERARIGAAARRAVHERFDWDTYSARLLAVIAGQRTND